MQVKICGTTSIEDACLALEAGADFVGVIVHHPPSPRNVSLEVAHAIKQIVGDKLVLLSVNQPLGPLRTLNETFQPHALQLHGDESPELVAQLTQRGARVWKAIHGDASSLNEQARSFRDAGANALLVDAREANATGTVYGGTGKIADWDGARALVDAGFRVILAGGLSPQNVARAIGHVHPFAVDCVSGVEATKGIKTPDLVRAFVSEARISSR